MRGNLRERKTTPPPCQEACPAGVDVSRYIRLIKKGEFARARSVVREAIPFSAVCSFACTHPCEVRCARIQYDEPLAIRLLKRAAEEYSRPEPDPFTKFPPTHKRVAIVGAGPCGLTAGYYLALLGHQVAIFEAQDQPGGMLWYGIPSYRLPRAVLAGEIELIRRQGVEIVTNRFIERPGDLLAEGFDAVLLATGAWELQKMGIPGENGPEVIGGLAFLKDINNGLRPQVGKRVIVVGGGNTAIDAARSSVRLGAEVVLLYRRREEDMPASAEEIEEAREEGVRMEFLTAPVKVEKGVVTCIRMALGPPDSSGRPSPVPVEGSEYEMEADRVIMAVGQVAKGGSSWGLATNSRGTIAVDGETLATSRPGIFAAGDGVTGPSTIIEAIAQGKQASRMIDRYLGGRGSLDFLTKSDREEDDGQTASRGQTRPVATKIPVCKRVGSFDLTEDPLAQDQAVSEARRCLACDLREYEVVVNPNLCKECGYCQEICRLDIFSRADYFNPSGYRPAQVVRPHRCVGCLKCLYICPDFAIEVNQLGGINGATG